MIPRTPGSRPGSTTQQKRKPRPRVILYSTVQCHYCRQTKDLLDRLGVRFTEYDVGRNRRAFTEFERAGGRGVPLVVIGGNSVKGFDPREIRRLLRQAGYDA